MQRISEDYLTTEKRNAWFGGRLRLCSPFAVLLAIAALAAAGIADHEQGGGDAKAQNGIPNAYRVTDLGTLGGRYVSPAAINNSGQIVGQSSTRSGAKHAFLWERGTMTDLGPGGQRTGFALDINDKGHVVGFFESKRGGLRAFLHKDGDAVDLGTLGGPQSGAVGINNRGVVVGVAQNKRQEMRPCMWTDGQMHDLGDPGRRQIEVFGISDTGLLVGKSEIPRSLTDLQPFVWKDGVQVDLGALARNPSCAMYVSNQGKIIIWGIGQNSINSSFVWDDGRQEEIDLLPGYDTTYAKAVNDHGTAVGFSGILFSEKNRAFIWHNGVMRDMNDLIPSDSGWQLTVASDINNSGEIIGEGEYKGRKRAFLLSPVN